MDLDEEDDENVVVNHQSNELPTIVEDGQGVLTKNQTTNTKSKLSVQDNNNINDQQQPMGDEWEEFEDSNSKYEKLRLKLSRPTNGDDENENDDYSDDENHHIDENDEEQALRNARRREQQDKPVWKLDQVQQPTITESTTTTEKIEEPTVTSFKTAVTTGAYKPPQLRGGNTSSVTVISGANQRLSKKEKPNLASTEEFPTLGAVVNKK